MRLVMTVDAVGGVWQYATDLAPGLRPLGFDPLLVVLGPPPSPDQRSAAAGVRLIETGLPLDWMAADEAEVRRTARAIADLARAEAADLIQLNQPAFAAEPMPAPVIAAVHSCVATWWQAVERGALPDAFAWQAVLVRAGLARAAASVCPSHAYAAAVRAAYGLARAPAVVHNGRRVAAPAGGPMRDVAFTAGRLWDRGKDVATLDRAAALTRVPLFAAGPLEGPNGERAALAHARPLGRLDATALDERLAERPVFVSAARYEPFGLAVLEAAAAGCAPVLSDIATFRELWGDAALFVQPGDDDGFADTIAMLVADPPRRARLGACAQQRAARYTPAAMAAGMAAIYRDAATRRAAA